MADSDTRHAVLLKSIRDSRRLAPPDAPFILASGKTSTDYVDLRRAIMKNGLFMHDAAMALLNLLPGEVDAIGGVPTAGLLLMGAMLAVDGSDIESLAGFYTRSEAKQHGLQTQVEGLPIRGIACMVEDTVTTGKSLLEHIGIARQHGVDVRYAVALLDRDEGGREALAEVGVTLSAVFTRQDLD